MTYKVKNKPTKKGKYVYEFKANGSVIRAKSRAELDRKLDKEPILWGYKNF